MTDKELIAKIRTSANSWALARKPAHAAWENFVASRLEALVEENERLKTNA